MTRIDIATEFGVDAFNAINDNADQSFAIVEIDTDGVISFKDDLDTTDLATLPTGGFDDKIISGWNGVIAGAFQVDYDATTFRYQNQLLSFVGGTVGLTAADANFDRIDAVYVDETATVTVVDGTASGLPNVPAFTGLFLTYVYVQRNGFGDPFLFTATDEFIRLRISRSVVSKPNDLTVGTALIESAYAYLSDSNLTHTLPASPTNGARLLIMNGDGLAATNPITINAGVGDTILGLPSFLISTNYGAVEFWYNETTTDWYVKNYGDPNVTPNVAPFYTTADETLTSAYSRVIAGVGTSNLTLPNAADCFNGQSYLIKNRSGGAINVIADADFDGNPSPLIIANGTAFTLIYSTDTNDWNIN